MWIGVIALVFAMPPGPSSPQGPPPERSVAWQLPDEALGSRITPILLLSRPDVRRELEMGPEQELAAKQAIDELYRRAAALRGQTGPEAVAARGAVDSAARSWIAEHLTETQRERLGQIDLQWEGPSALVDRAAIAASLNLSDEQRRQIAEAVARPPSPGEGPIDRHRRRHREAALALTDEQRLRWLAMLGPPFEPDPVTIAGVPRPNGG
ncbi:hypothetical protein [Tautonia sociabilis]|uniref:Uncharacterized protein n=1 Tax=Tautonia sociabilis TaxID=2080755 RepID=A0A432MHE7_9BACT|nr:hypothetical protein [Tautonia sociabilis]RUL86214.1 hypothetical protein TsocGM_16780 [Tautonia sociabilis]